MEVRIGIPNDGYLEKASFNKKNFAKLLQNKKVQDLMNKLENQFNSSSSISMDEQYLKNHLFDKLINTSKEVVRGHLPDTSHRTKILNRIDDLRLDISLCGKDLSHVGASTDGREINLCTGTIINSTSLFSLIFTIGHEIGHSFDPCAYAGKKYPYQNVLSCLEGSRSSNIETDGSTEEKINEILIPNHLNSTSRCSYSSQKGEVFADWFGTEVLAKTLPTLSLTTQRLGIEEYRSGIANIQKMLCSIPTGHEDGLFKNHQNSQKRANPILLAHPEIRKRMNCPVKHPSFDYCNVNNKPIESKPEILQWSSK